MKYVPENHSSKLEITGSKSSLLANKKILVCLTGSVAVLEIVSLTRLLMRHGAEIYTVLSPAAEKLVHPSLIEWATGNPVIRELTGQIEHVHLCGDHPEKVDLILIAPSTANTIGKIANGIDDTVVTTMATTALGSRIPFVIVPAMHASMYENPIILENIETLKNHNVIFVGPRKEEGKAKIAKNESILETIISCLTPGDLSGKKIVITAGPTRVWLDDIRFLSNPSSGQTGIALAHEAASRGADVHLFLGPTNLSVNNPTIEVSMFETPSDLLAQLKNISNMDVFISSAAISDYEPKTSFSGKIVSQQKDLSITFNPTPKIIDIMRTKFPDAFIIGYKAESLPTFKELENKALKKMAEKKMDMIVANNVKKTEKGFAVRENELLIITPKKKVIHLPMQSKRRLAKKILDYLPK
ncbi:MAG: bifunctional phosphopantothenoylcysteine decarboxylase/phosphopantothenate--cysteine ligase CoaBC [Asgard group archaeon]|nr:bifunctional phosphopantothenoylcysteine decarboxylase/phosphopantothenate--cysteine ligase CoaBC [Asgard group archaeon]